MAGARFSATSVIATLMIALILIVSGPVPGPAGATFAAAPNTMAQGAVAQSQPREVHVELVGQIGGATYALAVQGNYAYVGVGPRLIILDVSDPANPTMVGQTDVLPGVVEDMVILENYAYIACRNGLCIIDISDPTHPSEISFLPLPGFAIDLAIAGNYAYVADGAAGLYIVNITSLTSPATIGFYDTPGEARGVAVWENYVYVADGREGLRILDVNNPYYPTERGFYKDGVAYYDDVAVIKNHVLVADSDGLRIINVTNPMHPTQAGFYDLPRSACDVVVVENYAYVAHWDGVDIVSITNLTRPTQIRSIWWADSFTQSVAVSGNYVYVATHSKGLNIFYVPDSTDPSQVGVYNQLGLAHGVAVSESLVYVAGHASGLRIIDVTDRAHPIETNFYQTRVQYARDVALVGNYAYVADYSGCLHIINISDLAQPASYYSVPGQVYSVEVSGTYAYLGGSRLSILNASNPAEPYETSICDVLALDTAVAGNLVYVAGYDNMHIIDVSEVEHPRKVASYDTPGRACGVAVAGKYAYVADGNQGLRVIDVADPENPQEVGFYNVPGYTLNVTLMGNYAYVASTIGVYILYIADPADPILVGFYNSAGAAYDVAVAGNEVYVANGDSGLVILRFLSPVSTFTVPTSGGSFTSTVDSTTYIVPADAFTDTVTITHIPILPGDAYSPGNLLGIHHFFKVTAVYRNTNQPAQLAPGQTYTITVHYTDAEKGPAIEETLALYYWDGSQWVREPTSRVNAGANIITAQPDRFGTWAVLGETRRVYLPLTMRARR